MFNRISGLYINDGNFYNVSGDLNIQSHQQLTLQDQQGHMERIQSEWDATRAKTGGRQKECGRELSSVSRNVRHGMSERSVPYDISSRPRPSAGSPSPLNVHPGQPALSPILPIHNRSASTSNSQNHHAYQDSNISAYPGDLDSPQNVPYYQANSLGGHTREQDLSHHRQGQTTQPVQGGTFIAAENVNHSHGEDGINLLHRSVALEALYDSADSFPQPRCHPETRKEMLDDLYDWAISDDTVHSIRWLHGPAGAGKSRRSGHPTRGNAKVLFATLVYQFAFRNRHWKSVISRSVEEDSTVVGRHMDVQLHKLIIGPSQWFADTAPPSPSPVLLIDGLDECESAQAEILPDQNRTFAKFFEDPSFSGLYQATNVRQAFEDVQRYLCDEFSRIHREHRGTMGSIPTPWPSLEVLAMLVEKSSGYFIYASTAIKFIDDKHFRPTEQLDLIRNLVPSDSESPLDTLDQLYTQILSRVPQRKRAKLCDILCVIANF
ncbi:hypothetical protein B0H13DRAFT_2360705 [Mycena leptocephala]|nr:hypothetical protein B0H13DRAFT_2360705 [Mycena leptocephala]